MPFLDSTSRMPWSPPGRSGTSTATTVVLLIRIALFLQDAARLVDVVHDQPEDAEIGGVRQRQGSDVDLGILQDTSHLLQTSRFILQKYGNLFHLHR